RDTHHHLRCAGGDARDGLQVFNERRPAPFGGMGGRAFPPPDGTAQQAVQGFERLTHSQPPAGAQRMVAVSTSARMFSRKTVTAEAVSKSTGSRSARVSNRPWWRDLVSWLRFVPTIDSW